MDTTLPTTQSAPQNATQTLSTWFAWPPRLAFIPGWLNGKAMLETRGFFWAWFIHFWMDTVIFFFMALGAVTPGG